MKAKSNAKTLFVCGMKSEADLVPKGIECLVSAGNIPLLRERLAALNPDDYYCVVSFGIAGALDPQYKPGTIVRNVNEITSLDTVLATDPTSRAKLLAETGAKAIDQESLSVKAWAATNGIPFRLCRAIADPADFTLPPAALLPLKSDGSPDLWAIMQSILANPVQLGAVVKAGLYTNTALFALKNWTGLPGFQHMGAI